MARRLSWGITAVAAGVAIVVIAVVRADRRGGGASSVDLQNSRPADPAALPPVAAVAADPAPAPSTAPALPPAPDSAPSAVRGPNAGAGAPPATAGQADAVRPSRPATRGEADLMKRLREIKDKDPAAAVDLAREGNRRFPDSPDAPERASVLVHALATQGQASQARGAAEAMVNHYPDSDWVREVEQFSGAHRHRNIRVTDAGMLVTE